MVEMLFFLSPMFACYFSFDLGITNEQMTRTDFSRKNDFLFWMHSVPLNVIIEKINHQNYKRQLVRIYILNLWVDFQKYRLTNFTS